MSGIKYIDRIPDDLREDYPTYKYFELFLRNNHLLECKNQIQKLLGTRFGSTYE
jgi:hypothetical protein